MAKMLPVLLITGAPGAGKTALAKEIGEQLFQAAVPHAVIDLDELARMRPAAVPTEAVWTHLVVKNLGAIWPNYQQLGIDRLILAGIVRSAETVDALSAAIPGAALTVCRVHAPLDTLDARLRHREPGTVRPFLVQIAPQLDEHIADLGLESLAIDNGPGRMIGEAARTVLEYLRWPTSNPVSPTSG